MKKRENIILLTWFFTSNFINNVARDFIFASKVNLNTQSM